MRAHPLPLCAVRLLREELYHLQEPGSYVGEVVKAMGKSKVLVKVNPEGKYVVDIDKVRTIIYTHIYVELRFKIRIYVPATHASASCTYLPMGLGRYCITSSSLDIYTLAWRNLALRLRMSS